MRVDIESNVCSSIFYLPYISVDGDLLFQVREILKKALDEFDSVINVIDTTCLSDAMHTKLSVAQIQRSRAQSCCQHWANGRATAIDLRVSSVRTKCFYNIDGSQQCVRLVAAFGSRRSLQGTDLESFLTT